MVMMGGIAWWQDLQSGVSGLDGALVERIHGRALEEVAEVALVVV